MKTVPVIEAKNHLSKLLAAVEKGEIVSITRRGRPVARLVSIDAQEVAPGQQVADALATLKDLRQSVHLTGDLKKIAREGLD